MRVKQVRTVLRGPQVKYTALPSRHRQGGWEGGGGAGLPQTGTQASRDYQASKNQRTTELPPTGFPGSEPGPYMENRDLRVPQASVCFPDCVGS